VRKAFVSILMIMASYHLSVFLAVAWVNIPLLLRRTGAGSILHAEVMNAHRHVNCTQSKTVLLHQTLCCGQKLLTHVTDAATALLQAKETPLEAYLAQGGTAQVSMQALRDRVDTMLQQGGMSAATALATTRTTRSRAAAGSGATTAAEPAGARTTRRGKATAGAAADNMQNMPPATVVGKQAAIRKAQKGEVLYSVNGEHAEPLLTSSMLCAVCCTCSTSLCDLV
jgi:hypothetical protein